MTHTHKALIGISVLAATTFFAKWISRQKKKRNLSQTLNCEHKNLPLPQFDEEAAQGLCVYEVRRLWPREYVTCPDCGEKVRQPPASEEHREAGYW